MDVPPPPRGIKLGDVHFIKMLEFSVGVACGAKQFLYFTQNVIFLLIFSLGMPAGATS